MEIDKKLGKMFAPRRINREENDDKKDDKVDDDDDKDDEDKSDDEDDKDKDKEDESCKKKNHTTLASLAFSTYFFSLY